MQTILAKNLKVYLLGLPALTSFNIVKWVDAVEPQGSKIKKELPKVFQGLGDLGEEYHIQLK